MEYMYDRRMIRFVETAGLMLIISGQVVEAYENVSDDLFLDDISISAGVRLCAMVNLNMYNICNQAILAISCIDKDNLDELSIRYYISIKDARKLEEVISIYGAHSNVVVKYLVNNIISKYSPIVINETASRLNTERNIVRNKK